MRLGWIMVGGIASRRPNDLLRRARESRISPSGSGRPLSRQELADAASVHLSQPVTGDYIARLERGELRWPAKATRHALRRVLGANHDHELGFYITRRTNGRPTAQVPDPVPAAPITVGNPPHVSASAVDLWELHEALQGRTIGERGTVLVERMSRNLDLIYAHTPPDEIVPEVRAQMGRVIKYLGWPQPVGYRRRHCGVAGRLAGLLGWLHFDLADARTAEAWYVLAIDAACEAEDWSLLGWLHGGRSLIPFQRGEHHEALALIDAGRDLCPTAADSTVHAWLTALQARALAGVGDRSGFERAFDQAITVSAVTTTDQQRHGMDFHDGRLDLNYYRGGALLALGRPADAAQALRVALDILPDTRPKARAVLTLGLAEAAVMDGGLEEAADLLGRALATAHHQTIMPIVTMARGVTAALGARGFRTAPIVDALHSMHETLALKSSSWS